MDKFASAPDAVDILRSMMSTVYRNVVVRDGKRYCFEEVKPDEEAVYEFLCVKGCVKEVGGRHVVRVERPGLPTEEELEDLRADIAKGDDGVGQKGEALQCPTPSYLSLSAQVLVNAEALDNVVRHREASVVYRLERKEKDKDEGEEGRRKVVY
ncbi:hypothetical protein Pogu_1114 [Pyrobaculum oguniense TE7]|uniref:Uncharacterized protein n=1 Tax=Pyrobaculum oguniense (strain DSM 13380 / JCM 10595 / TE7) TaxID=698757 RepID=H6QA19_PYROT|nr:hypothetical protein Pogu_1114 [Pyrobaculum oguniense TE7]